MGTHMGRMIAMIAVLCLALGAAAWAAPAETEVSCPDMQAAGVCGHSTGAVYYYDDRRPEAWVTLGGSDGLRVRARVQFVRNDEVVGEGTVTAVKDADCIVSPDKDVVGGAIMLGDAVHVVKNGTRGDVNSAITRERRGQMLLTLLVTGGLAYLIGL